MTTHTLTAAGAGPVDVTVDERGQGRPFLLLHGGAGPQSVAGFAELLSTREHARVYTPIQQLLRAIWDYADTGATGRSSR
jgi:hypothetical protein